MNKKQTITVFIGDEACDLRLTMGAMLRFKEKTGKEVTEINSMADQAELMYACAQSAAAAKGEKFCFTLQQFADNLDLRDLEAFGRMLSAGDEADDSKKGGLEPLPSIERLLGIALGGVGMSLKDFCSLTPAQFRAVLDAYEHRHREAWEQMRFLACAMLQPYSKKRLRPTDVVRFEWDDKRDNAAHERKPSERSTVERFRRVANRG